MRSQSEFTGEIHRLNQFLTNRTIQRVDAERDDLDIIDSIHAQIDVIEGRLSYSSMLAEYEEEGEYICGAAYDAYEWLFEDGQSPSAQWATSVGVFDCVTPTAVVIRAAAERLRVNV